MKYQNLIGHINADINTNGNHAITGAKLNSALNEIVSVLGDGYRIAGLAHIGDQAPSPAENGMCYIAMDEGTYVNFGNVTRRGDELVLIYYDGSAWQKMAIRNKTFGYVEIRNGYTVLSSSEMDELRKDFAIIFDVRTDNKDVYFKCQHKVDGEDHDSMTFRTMPDIRISMSSNSFSLLMNVITVGYNSDSGMYFALLDTQTCSKEVYDANAVDWLLARKQNTLTFDTVPTDGSSNPVTSGGVEKAISEIQSSIPVVPTNVSAFTNDAGYLTKHQDISGKEDVSNKIDEWVDNLNKGQYPSAKLVKSALDRKYQKPANGIPASDLERGIIPTVPTISTDISSDATSDTKTASPKAVKTYVDGAIPTVPTISTDIAADATSDVKTASPKAVKTFVEGKGYGNYSKPSGGIPKTDLATAVQTSLGLADTALQSYTETDPVFSASAAAGITSSDIAEWDGKAEPTPVVDASSQAPSTMAPNTVYRYGTLSGDTTFPAFATPASNAVANVWCWTFTTPSTAPTITWPVGITAWAGGSAPTINASKSYEVSVMDGLALIVES